ncbi:MAG: DinB family protein [Planctomycetes bacterium]|nr:DinB family protein [Planctomycetota bacterium]
MPEAESLENLVRLLENERRYTSTLLRAFPLAHGGFRPKPEMMTAAGQVHHIADGELWRVRGCRSDDWSLDVFGRGTSSSTDLAGAVTRLADVRKATMAYVHRLTFDELRSPPGDAAPFPDLTVGEILETAATHESHHRGQLVVYLRLLGIAPPALFTSAE